VPSLDVVDVELELLPPKQEDSKNNVAIIILRNIERKPITPLLKKYGLNNDLYYRGKNL